MPENYRPELPPVPSRMRHLPVVRGYPVPWFVARQENGEYDFRIADERKIREAIVGQKCWVCGSPLGRNRAFVIGPMCAVNRVSSEPPSHRECAIFSATACPFLNFREPKRRPIEAPAYLVVPPGEMITRNPEVTLVWVTRKYIIEPVGGGVLFRLSENPIETLWYSHGRPAIRDEVLKSIDGGLPALMREAKSKGLVAIEHLKKQMEAAEPFLPPKETHGRENTEPRHSHQ